MWKSLEEEMPKLNVGILFKVIPKPGEDYRSIEEEDVLGKLYYGYAYAKFRIMVRAEIKDMDITQMGWKITKEFDEDEIFWFYESLFSSLHKEYTSEEEKTLSDISEYGKYIKIKN